MVCLSQRWSWAWRVQMLSGVFEAVAMVSLCRSLQWALAAIRRRAFRKERAASAAQNAAVCFLVSYMPLARSAPRVKA